MDGSGAHSYDFSVWSHMKGFLLRILLFCVTVAGESAAILTSLP
jgi:hypothetical protein